MAVRKILWPKHLLAIDTEWVAKAVNVVKTDRYLILSRRQAMGNDKVEHLFDRIVSYSLDSHFFPALRYFFTLVNEFSNS